MKINARHENASGSDMKDKDKNTALGFLYGTAIGRACLKLVIKPEVSKAVSLAMNSRISVLAVNRFILKNHIDMSDYKAVKFKSFNDFFIREIKPERRPIDTDKNHLISPCDAKVSAYRIDHNSTFYIKQTWYSAEDLIENTALAEAFQGGYCLIFRLEADNYHHYCYIDDGQKGENTFIQGKLHTVQPIAMKRYPVFRQNCREYTVLETENFETVVQIEVGALLVGKIKNFHQQYSFKKGEEKGIFEFGGSTVVLLLQKDVVVIEDKILENTEKGFETSVKMGEKIGRKK